MAKKIKVFVVSRETGKAYRDEIEDDLHVFYKVMNCDLIDITMRRIGKGKTLYNIICDDEGLLKENEFTLFSNTGRGLIAGTVIIARQTRDGELKSLTEADYKLMEENVVLNTHNNKYVLANVY